MPATSKSIQLSQRDLAMIRDIARYKFLSSFQLERLYFTEIKHRRYDPADPSTEAQRANSRHRTAENRLNHLKQNGLLSKVFAYPKASDNPKIGHPTAVYYLSPQNLKNLQTTLAAKSNASAYEEYQDLATTANHDEEFSHQYLEHELGISDIFMSVEASAIRNGWQILFWERTSPFSRDIREEFIIETTKTNANGNTRIMREKLFFNPDGVLGLQDPDGYKYFFTVEYDNDSCTIPEYNKKLRGCIEYRTRKLFPQLTTHYANKYGFKVANPNVGWRVLNITPDAQRRNALFQDSLSLHAYKYLMFASMTDIQPDQFLGSVWLRGKEYPEAKAHLEQILPREASPALQRRTQHETLNNPDLMPRVSLLD